MRRAYLFGGLVASCALAALWSCGLDDTAVVSIDNADGATPDASFVDGSGDGATNDSSPGDSGIIDSGVPDTGPCVGTFPTCDDGTGCGSSKICTPPIPTGWHVTNLISNAQSCDYAYGGDAGAKSVVEIADGGPAACTCNCTSTGDPSCANVHVELGIGATCTDVTEHLDMVNNCDALSASIGPTANTLAAVSILPTATCSGSVAPSIPTIDGGLATTCDLNGDAGAICLEHRQCVPKPSNGHVCIAQAAPTSAGLGCPSGFSYSLQTTVASSFSDTRACSACSCGFNGTGCTNPKVSFHPLVACGGTGTEISQNNCSNVGTGLSVGVTGTNVDPCVQNDGGVLDGGTTIVAPETVCCSN